MRIVVRFRDGAFDKFATRLANLAENGRGEMASALNAAGAAVRRATVAAETAQTGLKGDVIDRAQVAQAAASGSLVYRIKAQGGDVRLKFFGARETPAGVTAHPWNRQTLYAGAFTRGGRWPRRVGLNKGGAVMQRVGRARLPVRGVKSGLYIPTEMTTGATAAAFRRGSATAGAAILTRLQALLG